jgi:NAD-dependent dihydropyrimidine dehydrogenase PreA subunit
MQRIGSRENMKSSEIKNHTKILDYKFHHIDISKCENCRDFACEDACFRGIYKVINKDSTPKCIVVEEREENCVKCHICTTECSLRAITID